MATTAANFRIAIIMCRKRISSNIKLINDGSNDFMIRITNRQVQVVQWFTGSGGSVVRLVRCGSSGSMVHWFRWFIISSGSLVQWFGWFTGSVQPRNKFTSCLDVNR